MSDHRGYLLPTPAPCDPVVPEGSLAALAHDMRGPLDAIRNAGHLLTLARDDFTTGKMLRLIDRQVAYLSSIADMLAEMARGGRRSNRRRRREGPTGTNCSFGRGVMLVEFDSVQMRGMKKIFIDADSIVSIADIPQNLGTSCRVQYADNQSVDVTGALPTPPDESTKPSRRGPEEHGRGEPRAAVVRRGASAGRLLEPCELPERSTQAPLRHVRSRVPRRTARGGTRRPPDPCVAAREASTEAGRAPG